MKITRKKKEIINGLDSGALTDLSFLLIIYFIVISGFSLQSGFLLDLPGKGGRAAVFTDEVMRFHLNVDGAVGLLIENGEKSMGETEIRERISATLSNRPNLIVSLLIEPEVPWQHVVNFIELSQMLKVENFSFNIRRADSTEGN